MHGTDFVCMKSQCVVNSTSTELSGLKYGVSYDQLVPQLALDMEKRVTLLLLHIK